MSCWHFIVDYHRDYVGWNHSDSLLGGLSIILVGNLLGNLGGNIVRNLGGDLGGILGETLGETLWGKLVESLGGI